MRLGDLSTHTEAVEQVGCGVVAKLFLTVVHSGNLDNYGEVTSGLNGNGDRGDLKTEDLGGLLLEAHTVVDLLVVPGLDIYDVVDLFGKLYGTCTENSAHVNNSDTAKLDKVTDVAWCGTDKGFV